MTRAGPARIRSPHSLQALGPAGDSRRHRNGFILLEILVALAILALTLGMAFQSLSGSFRWLDRGARQTAATLLARSLLDAAAVDPVPATGRTTDGLDWRVETAPTDPRTLRVTVSWTEMGATRALSLPGIVP